VTVGFHAPLPPARTGVADYAAALLADLRGRGRVEIAPARCDVALYHLGNNKLHAAIYRRATERPGVVVLHDAVLNHFYLGQLDEAAYTEEFVYNYGEWNRGLGRELWRNRAASGADRRYFDFPMLRRVAERALAAVVHNPAAAEIVRRHAPGARIVEIPHLFVPPELPSVSQVLGFRERLGIPPGAFLFGVFGYLRETKRLLQVLDAFAAVAREVPHAMLLVAGDFVSSDLERAAAPLLAAPHVRRLPYLPGADFWLAASAVDACINLRYPAAGETSGITIRLMGIGKPVLVTDSAECQRFPQGAVVRVAPGVGERQSLCAHVVLLTSISEVARAIGQRGAGHIQTRHRVELVGRLYWDLLCECCASSQSAPLLSADRRGSRP
jgi:glycosyltransferase involved in cell wall biosynthesis